MIITNQAQDNFMKEFDFESDTSNFKIGFAKMTKMHGAPYIRFCQDMWAANEGAQTEDEFMAINGNMPRGFFENKIKK